MEKILCGLRDEPIGEPESDSLIHGPSLEASAVHLVLYSFDRGRPMRFIAEWTVGLLTRVPDYDPPAAVSSERNIEKRLFSDLPRRHQLLCWMLGAYPFAWHPNQPAFLCASRLPCGRV